MNSLNTLSQPLEPGSPTSLEPELPPSGVGRGEVRIKGKDLLVPSVQIEGRTVITTGSVLKVATVRDEELVEGDTVAEPERFVSLLKGSGLRADIFTFGQRVPNVAAKYSYKTEWENAAAIPITTYAQWLKERCEYSIRKGVNRAAKLGVVTRIVKFDEQLLDAICRIYNESPVRQGKRFWHYGKNREAVKRAMETYLDRSIFIGAYLQEELIGFIKMTWVGTTGTLTQIISMRKHFDKKPNNSLLAKGVEVCETEGKSHFIYGSFVYFDPNSTLTEFKRRSGFEPVPLPRYYVPLTLKGKIALKLGLHRGVIGNTPKPLLSLFLKARKYRFERKSRQGSKQEK